MLRGLIAILRAKRAKPSPFVPNAYRRRRLEMRKVCRQS